jgi:hypothetical protein
MGSKRGRLLTWVVLTMFHLNPGRVDAAAGAHTIEPESEPMLVGVTTREAIELAMPGWVEETVLASPDPEAARALADALQGAEVTVFFGLWCEDSARELSRLWRALDEAGLVAASEIRYVGVDREKRAPQGLADGWEVQWVPTFVVKRSGVEVGRIVESSVHGIEEDLRALLVGEQAGLISASPEIAGGDRP